jgi:hypothetical protein
MAVTAALWRGLAGTGGNARPMFTSSDGVTSASQRDQIGTAGQASSADVIERLQANDVQVMAVANPLRGISIDSAYVASVFDQIPGPVLAVGHSYRGAVISKAASGANNVVGLVFVAAFAGRG